MKSLLDLYCGRGGWTRHFQRLGWKCVGVDLAVLGYPATFMQADVRELSEKFMRQFTAIVASPPCEEFARECLPWLRGSQQEPKEAADLLRWTVRLAARIEVPCLVECSKFAARFVPGSVLCGSWAFWGDVPLLMPQVRGVKTAQSGLRPEVRAMVPAEFAHTFATWVTAR